MAWRIRDRATFEALRRSPARARRGPVTVSYAPVGAADEPRVAYAVGRRLGTAVLRNRVRRRLRAAVDETTGLSAGAYLVSAGREAAVLGFEDLKKNVSEAMTAAVSSSSGGSGR